MARQKRYYRILARKWVRPFMLFGIVVFTITEIVALSPSNLEEGSSSSDAALDPEYFQDEPETTLASGIPTGIIPDYKIEDFNYVSSQGSEKQWKLIADKANVFNKQNIVHSRNIQALLYDPQGAVTVVTGKEAKYFVNSKDLEVFGNVKTTFPDGFELESDYLKYRPQARKIEIPPKYAVKGAGQETQGQLIRFTSRGLDFSVGEGLIVLLESARVSLEKRTPDSETKGIPERTTIDSDRCLIDRKRQFAHFTMHAERVGKNSKGRFVHITQPTLYSKSRRADLNYGEGAKKLLKYIVASDDVFIQELEPAPSGPHPHSPKPAKKPGEKSSLRYATAGKAEFDTKQDIIELTQFPQVYQDGDTVTGDVILLHRNTDVVEVEQSNAFSEGTKE